MGASPGLDSGRAGDPDRSMREALVGYQFMATAHDVRT